MSKKTKAPLAILPSPERPPLTVAEALRNIACEAMERRRLTAEEKSTLTWIAPQAQQDDSST